MKRAHAWSAHQCVRCGLRIALGGQAVVFPAERWDVEGEWVQLAEKGMPNCGETEARWRARVAPKPKRRGAE